MSGRSSLVRGIVAFLLLITLTGWAAAQSDRRGGRGSRTPRAPGAAAPWRAAASTNASSSVASDGGAGNSADSEARYQIIVQRNIFSRERWRPVPRASRPPEPPRPEQMLVLIGTVLPEDDAEEPLAFFEDRRTGTTSKVQPGQTLASGKVVRIDFDCVEYESGGQVRRVDVGMNLEGAAPLAPSAGGDSGAAMGAGTATSSDQSSSGSGSGSDDIVERLKRKRLESLGQLPAPATQPQEQAR